MAASKTGPKAPKIIDIEQLEKLAEKLWSKEQIAAFFKCSVDTINRHHAAFIEECRQRGKARIKDMQWKRAIEGSDRMILHLSEHHLGEVPQSKSELSGEAGFKIEIVDYSKK